MGEGHADLDRSRQRLHPGRAFVQPANELLHRRTCIRMGQAGNGRVEPRRPIELVEKPGFAQVEAEVQRCHPSAHLDARVVPAAVPVRDPASPAGGGAEDDLGHRVELRSEVADLRVDPACSRHRLVVVRGGDRDPVVGARRRVRSELAHEDAVAVGRPEDDLDALVAFRPGRVAVRRSRDTRMAADKDAEGDRKADE